MLLDIGRVCVKVVGHEADKKCVIVDHSGENFVVVAGPHVKKRRCNIRHLQILPQKLDVKKGASEQEVADALLKAGLVSQGELAGKPAGYTPRPRGGERKTTPAKTAAATKKAEKIAVKAKK